MSLYFFHLTFGDRISLDEEGVELPSRCAACEEAMAVVSELSDPALGGNPRRWASWFLQVAVTLPCNWYRRTKSRSGGRPDAARCWRSGRIHSGTVRHNCSDAIGSCDTSVYANFWHARKPGCAPASRSRPRLVRPSRRIAVRRTAPRRSRRGAHLPISSCCRAGVDRNFSRCTGFGCQIDKRHLPDRSTQFPHDLMVRRLAVSSWE